MSEPPEAAAVDLPPIQMLWFGRPLSSVELLSIASFLRHGHPVHLYTYGDIGQVPSGTTLKKAHDVVPEETFNRLRSRGVRPAMFADMFRYTLLHAIGGWWVDTDVVCLRPFVFPSDVVFGRQDEKRFNNAVLRIPAGHRLAAELLKGCFHPNRWRLGDNPRRIAAKTLSTLRGHHGLEHARWGSTGPDLLTSVVRRLRVDAYAVPAEVFYPLPDTQYKRLFVYDTLEFGQESFAVHLWNERKARANLEPAPGSPLHQWLTEYGIDPSPHALG